MFYNAFQKMLIGIAVLSFAAMSPVAAAANVSVLSDLENGTNENYYGAYWYVYDDHEDDGNTEITNMTKKADGTYDFLPTAGVGNTVAGGTPGYGAQVDFTLGSINPGDGTATWGSMVGIGTMLAQEGNYMDLTGAQKIEFYAKVERPTGTAATVDMRVEVCTAEFEAKNGGDYGFYHIIIPITGTWEKYTIPLDTTDVGFGKLVQWDWSIDNNGAKPFNITKISQVQFCISEDGNVTAWKDASGSLFIDDISISPFTPHFFDEIEADKLGPAGSGAPATSLLADMETTRNNVGFYSYCYTDVDANPLPENASVITAGAAPDSATGKYKMGVSEGGVGGGKCASITFELGTTFTEGNNTVQPFVGIGTNLVATDASGAPMEVCNLSTATAVYFDYKLESTNLQFVTFEYSTDQQFGNEGAVYYVKLPNTGGEWKGATVDLSTAAAELVLPKWEDITNPAALDKSKSTKLQWKVQGAARSTGTLALDNIYIPGFTPGVIHFGNKPSRKAAFSVKQLSNLARVSFALPQNVSTAKVDLVSMQGKVLASQSVQRNGSGRCLVEFPTTRLANGSYFVKVNYGNSDVKSSMISVIR